MTELTVETETFSQEDLDGKVCACGCGTPMSPTSKRAYIYGHKKDAEERDVSDDPEPSEEAKAKSATIRVTKALRDKMQEEIESYLLLSAGMWEMSDPVCGAVASQQASLIAEKLVPVLARNQVFVRYFRSTSSFREGMDLFLVLWPVVKVVGQHHVFHTIGAKKDEDGVPAFPLNGYVA